MGTGYLPSQVVQPPFYVPKLDGSSIFVKRTENINEVVSELFQHKSVTALWSPHCYGKTTLAKMVCYEPRIKQYFTGGIFWIEIRDNLDAKKALRKLYKNLTGYFVEDVEPYDLVQQWSQKPTLVVLDNVETKDELTLFLDSSGESCQFLITTQRLDIFSDCNDLKLIDLKPFDKRESVAVLIKPFEGKAEIDKNDQKKVEELADLLYDWPILLNLALKDIQVQMNMPHPPAPKIVIDNLIKKIKDWTNFDHENEIFMTIEESLKYLTREQKEYFQELFIFSADIDIPCSIIEKIWNLSEIKVDVHTLCCKLYYLSLLKKYDIGQQVIQLHEHLRRYFISNNEVKKLLAETNKKFVEYYVKQYNLNSPNDLPDNLPLPEKNFLLRVYKHHWKLAQNINSKAVY